VKKLWMRSTQARQQVLNNVLGTVFQRWYLKLDSQPPTQLAT
jgi:hypothetical protein